MKWTPQNSIDKILIDETGREIPCVQSFDDETFEAKFFIKSGNGVVICNGEALLITTILSGAQIVNKSNR